MRALTVVALLPVALACAGEPPAPPAAPPDPAYLAGVESWRAERYERLRRPDGWLSLVGLQWLGEGPSTLGADPASDVALPPGSAAAHLGVLRRSGDRVRFEAAPGAEVTLEGERVTAVEMAADLDGAPTVLEHGSLAFHVIRRGDRLGIRVKDLESALRREFRGIDHYPVDPAWRLAARFEPYAEVKMLPVPNITGDVLDQPVPGRVVFVVNGAEHALEPIGQAGGELFLVFGDATNGGETYGGGRFLDVAPPAADGSVVVDFNKAYNPPCVFTPYATCPLPPRSNRLVPAVRAGEKGFAATHPEG